MNLSIDEIIPQSAVQGVLRTAENIDAFTSSIRQISQFQGLLYEALKSLNDRFDNLEVDFRNLAKRSNDIDSSIEFYLKSHPQPTFTKDGISLDDALNNLGDMISSNVTRTQDCAETIDECVKTVKGLTKSEDFISLTKRIDETEKNSQTNFNIVESLHKSIDSEQSFLDEKWHTIKGLFQKEALSIHETLDEQLKSYEKCDYVHQCQLSDLCVLFGKILPENRHLIREIIPSILCKSDLTMEQKLLQCYDALNIEKTHNDKEKVDLDAEFTHLYELISASLQSEREADNFRECKVRDIATDSGFSQAFTVRDAALNMTASRRTVSTLFDGVELCFFDAMPMVKDLLDLIKGSEKKKETVNMASIVEDVLDKIDPIIEHKLEPILIASQKTDGLGIASLVRQLKSLDEVQSDVEKIKVKMSMKMDQSMFSNSLDQYITKKDFYSVIDSLNSGHEKPRPKTSFATVPKVKAITPKNSPEEPSDKSSDKKKPKVNLILSRNSKMLGVNEKFLAGDDGKLYLRDQPFKERAARPESAKISYYDRSKIMMESNGVESAMDYQAFVPLKTASKPNIEAEDFHCG